MVGFTSNTEKAGWGRPWFDFQSRTRNRRHRDELEILPASTFSMQQLTDAYNRTRADYIIPMPMSVTRLAEYVRIYDVDLSASCVIWDHTERAIAGLAMLGIRHDRAWITRLGVIPGTRKRGIGSKMMQALIDSAYTRNVDYIWLEVIQGNKPAHAMFHKFGFHETRELLIARRPPTKVAASLSNLPTDVTMQVVPVHEEEALALLQSRKVRPNWLNDIQSYANVSQKLGGFVLSGQDGSQGWVVYESDFYQLKRIVVNVTAGDCAKVTQTILSYLHQETPTQDASYENLPVDDPRWAGYQAAGYFDAFRRVEMVKPLL